MQQGLPATELELKVEEVRRPLEMLVESLDEQVRPTPLQSYGHGNSPQIVFDNEEGPPWTGEWNNKEEFTSE